MRSPSVECPFHAFEVFGFERASLEHDRVGDSDLAERVRWKRRTLNTGPRGSEQTVSRRAQNFRSAGRDARRHRGSLQPPAKQTREDTPAIPANQLSDPGLESVRGGYDGEVAAAGLVLT